MKIINLPRVGIPKNQFLNKNFFFSKFAPRVVPKVSPKPTTKAVFLVPPRNIPKAVLSNFPTKNPSSVPTSHIFVSLQLYIFGIYCS